MLVPPVPEGVGCPHTACLGPRPSDLGGLTSLLAFSAVVPFPCPAFLTSPASIVVRGGSVVKVGLAERVGLGSYLAFWKALQSSGPVSHSTRWWTRSSETPTDLIHP